MRGVAGRVVVANRSLGSGSGGADPAPPASSAVGASPSVKRSTRRHRALPGTGWLLLLDLPFYAIALAVALLIGTEQALLGTPNPTNLPAWPLALLLAPMSVALSATFGLYRPGILRSRRRQLAGGARTLVWSAAFSVGGVFLLSEEIPTGLRMLILVYHASLALWMLGGRTLLVAALRSRVHRGEERILILGAGRSAFEIAKGLTARSRGTARIVSFVDEKPPALRSLQPFRLAEMDALPEIAEAVRADQVIVARNDLPRAEIVRISDSLLLRGVRVKVLSDVFDRLFGSIPFETIHGLHLLQVGETPLRGRWQGFKRVIDLIGATVGGVLILPLLVGIAVAIRISSRGPILYAQTRIGRGGRPFIFYKFRSMIVHEPDAEHRRYLEAFLKDDAPASVDTNGKKIYKLADDPRVTLVGRILRRTSLDELPQLWNVLRGEMSLVGPRPCLPFEYEMYNDWQRRRLDVIPGMTGLWQVTGRSYVTFNDMVLLDLFYIGNWSLSLDAKLMLRTLPVIVFGKGGL